MADENAEDLETEIDDVELDLPDEDEDLIPGDDEAEPEDDEEVEAAAGAAPEQPSRSASRVQKLANERAAAKKELAEAKRSEEELRRRLTEVEARQRFDFQSETQRQAEAARIAQMDPVERENYEIKRRLDETQRQVADLDFKHKDEMDRAKFEANFEKAMDVLPGLKKFSGEIDKILDGMRTKGGVNAARMNILYHEYGKMIIEGALSKGKNSSKRVGAAEGRVAASKGRPANLRGDAVSGGKGKTEEDRLRGVQI